MRMKGLFILMSVINASLQRLYGQRSTGKSRQEYNFLEYLSFRESTLEKRFYYPEARTVHIQGSTQE